MRKTASDVERLRRFSTLVIRELVRYTDTLLTTEQEFALRQSIRDVCVHWGIFQTNDNPVIGTCPASLQFTAEDTGVFVQIDGTFMPVDQITISTASNDGSVTDTRPSPDEENGL